MNFAAGPKIVRESVHPSITEEQVSRLVDNFYEAVRSNGKLAPIFAGHLTGRWPPHLDKMKAFWRSVLMRTGEYSGKPVPVHLKIDGISTDDFAEWLQLFAHTAGETFEPEAAELVNAAAERIATSLWLSRQNDPFASPPHWASANSDNTAVAGKENI